MGGQAEAAPFQSSSPGPPCWTAAGVRSLQAQAPSPPPLLCTSHDLYLRSAIRVRQLGPCSSLFLRWSQPQRDGRGPHRLVHHSYQISPEDVDVDLVPNAHGERLQGTGGIVPSAVECAIDGGLN